MNLPSFRHRSLTRWLSITTLTAIATAVPAAESPPTAPSAPSGKSGSEAPSTIERLHSTILSEERAVPIQLPRDYACDTSTRYPVLFKLDDDNGLERHAAAVDTLSEAGAIPALIFVAIPNARGQRNRDMTPAQLHQEFEVAGKMATGEMGHGTWVGRMTLCAALARRRTAGPALDNRAGPRADHQQTPLVARCPRPCSTTSHPTALPVP